MNEAVDADLRAAVEAAVGDMLTAEAAAWASGLTPAQDAQAQRRS
ncbi:hypothetical protein ACU635_06680 [[Actinomadura] parvosata]